MSDHTATLWLVQRTTDDGTEIIGVYPTHAKAEAAVEDADNGYQGSYTHQMRLVPFYGDLAAIRQEEQT